MVLKRYRQPLLVTQRGGEETSSSLDKQSVPGVMRKRLSGPKLLKGTSIARLSQ